MLPTIRLHNNVTDHDYLASIIKLRSGLDNRSCGYVSLLDSLIRDEKEAMKRKTLNVQVRLLESNGSPSPANDLRSFLSKAHSRILFLCSPFVEKECTLTMQAMCNLFPFGTKA